MLKNDKFTAAARESEDAVRDVGSAVKGSTSEVADEFSGLGEQIAFQKQIIEDLEAKLKELEKAYKEAVPGNAYAEAVNEFNAVKRELDGEKRALEDMQNALESTGQKHVSLKSQLSAVREELAMMEASGQRGTEAYRQLQEKAGRLKDALSDANAQMSIMANDQRGMQGVISGLTGLSGALSAAAGAAGMLAGENKNLQLVMTKVQSLMAITVGLQQVQQTLDKDSAFRLVTINGLKAWWTKVVKDATAAELAETASLAANTEAQAANATVQGAGAAAATANAAATAAEGAAATGAAGAFRLLGAAIKNVPVIGWILAAVGAVIAVVGKLVKKWKEEREAQRKAMEEARKEAAEFRRAVGEKASDATARIEGLSAAYKRLGNDMQAKSRFIKDNAEDFRNLGVQVKSVADAENLLIRNKDKFIKAQTAKAMAEVYGEKIKGIMRDNMGVLGVDISPRPSGPKGEEIFDSAKEMISVQRARVVWRDIETLQKQALDFQERAESLLRENGIRAAHNTENTVKDAMDSYADESKYEGWLEKLQKLTDERDKKIQDILSKEGKVLHFESGDVTYDAEQIGIELKKIKEDFTNAVNDLAKEYHLEVPAEVDVTVKTNREAYEKLLDEYADYRRKIANINKQYDEQLKDAGDDESLKSRINTKRNQEIASVTIEAVKLNSSISTLLEGVDQLGNATRNLLLKRLKELVDFVKKNKGNLNVATDENAAKFGIDTEVLKNLLQSDEALSELEGHLERIGEKSGAIGKLTEAVRKFNAAKKDASGELVTEENVAKARDALVKAVQGVKAAVVTTLGDLGNALKEIGQTLGNRNLEVAGDVLDDFLTNIQAAEAGAQAWGGWWGAIIGGLTDLIPKIVKWMNYGTERSLEDVETMLSSTRTMLDYWMEIYEAGGKWKANDMTQSINTEEVQELVGKIKEARKEAAQGIVMIGAAFMRGGFGGLAEGIDKIKRGSLEITEYVGQIMDSIANGVDVSVQEAYENMLNTYDKMIEELEKKLEVLLRHPKKNAEEIQQILIQIAETTQEKYDAILSHAENVVGTTTDQLFSDFSDGIWDAFTQGTDAIEDFDKRFNETMANILRKKVLFAYLGNEIENFIKDLADSTENDELNEQKIEEFRERWRGMVSGGMEAMEQWRGIFDGLDISSGADAFAGSIKGITSEQAGILAGQLNAMRTGMYEQTGILTDSLRRLDDIERNTRYIQRIYQVVKGANNTEERRAYGIG